MRRSVNHALGLHRLLTTSAAGAADPDAVTETINVTNFSGQKTIDVTEINGITINNFAFIHFSYENVQEAGAGTGVQFGLRLSTDGGSTFLTTGYSGLQYFGTGTTAALTEQMDIAANGTDAYLSGLLMHLDSSGVRTVCKSINGGISTRHSITRHDTAAAHDAIQFRVRSDGDNVTFASGFIHLTGYRMPASRINVQTFDLATTPAANVVYNVPAGHTFVSMIVTGVTKDLAATGLLRVGKDGTLLSGASDYHSNIFTTAGQSSTDRTDFQASSASTTSAMTGVVDILNMNTLAPVIFDSHLQQAASNQAGGLLNSASQKNNTISFGTFGAQVMNAGTITFVSYRVRNTVNQITANSGTTTQTIDTSLTKAPMIALASTDLTMSALGTIGVQVGVSGTYSTTAGDYSFVSQFQNGAGGNKTETSARWSGNNVNTTHKTATLLLGMTKNQMPMLLWSWRGASATQPVRYCSTRDEDATYNDLRAVGVANFTSGTIYETLYHWN